MKILFACGGTAGHINPALAVADCIKRKNPEWQILFVGNKGGMEETLVSKAGFDMKLISISGFKRKLNFNAVKENIKTIQRTIASSKKSREIIKEFKPDICVGTGGYVSGPVLREAAKLGIPTLIHEQNAYPGIANKMLAKSAKYVMLAVRDAEKHFSKNARCIVTGNPVRNEIIMADKELAREKINVDSRPLILSFGGSLGARKINETLLKILIRSGKDGKYQHIHGYGKYGSFILDEIKQEGIELEKCRNLDLREYIDNMDECMAAADLVVSRAGAITLSEIQALGKPAILIPSPNVAENHQYHNAMALVNNGAAEIIEEKDLTEENLIEKIDMLLSDEEKLKEYSNNSKNMSIIDANDRIYSIIRKTLGMI